MTKGQRIIGAVVTAAILSSVGGIAYGDPAPPMAQVPIPGTGFLHVSVPWQLITSSGTKIDLPPGYVLDEPTWKKLDGEVKRLQDAETNLTAQNKSLTASMGGWEPGWWTVAGVLLAGAAGGWYLHEKI